MIPAIVAGMVAWKVATFALIEAERIRAALMVGAKFLQFIRIIMMISKAKGIWAAAQWALNIAMSANPLGLIIIGIAALIAIIVLLVTNWDVVKAAIIAGAKAVANWFIWLGGKIKEIALKIWDQFMSLLENPFFIAVSSLIAPWLIAAGLIIKHWSKIKEFFIGLWETIKPIIDGIKGIGKFVGGKFGFGKDKPGPGEGDLPISPNQSLIESRTTNTTNSNLDINLKGSENADVQSNILGPGINLNLGGA